MSYLSTNTNSSHALQNALNSLNIVSNPNGLHTLGTINSSSINTTSNYSGSAGIFKMLPTFKMELFKSENGGFILNLITMNTSTYQDVSKLFILSDLQNMGRDIQNIIATEILKS